MRPRLLGLMVKVLVTLAVAVVILVAQEWFGGYVANGCQYLPNGPPGVPPLHAERLG